MRSPEVSPSSLDVVIAPVICWQKRGTEKIWQLGKTSTPPHADVAQSDRAEQGKCRVPAVGSSPTVCTRSSAPAKYKLERASGDRAQEGSRNVYLSGLTASSRHAAVTAGKDRHPRSVSVQRSAHRSSKPRVAVRIRYAAPCPPDGRLPPSGMKPPRLAAVSPGRTSR